ncbi:NtaA/DmoA family FMN-dependent monooxygenase [Streptomyces sp. NPDC050287]|uniref:NtaA/DmoA family FMN-dependent monooxygenase n=1 Tax=Streptomyces sp. NPDC050287 TaxID=3365608 RepID=UPI0037B47B53
MAGKQFHMGWFMNFTTNEWNTPFGNDGMPWNGKFYIEMAQAMERACFDYIMIEDTLMVSEAYGGTSEAYLKYASMAPKGDPAPLAAIMSAATSRMGVVATMSTTFYPPFMLARLCSTLDSIAEGRFGWNIVTSGEDGSAQNFGMDKLTEHDLRYDKADEYVDLVCKLWDSWEPDAVVRDRETNTYADFKKVRPINFSGKYYKSRGPLNTVRSPQGRPVFVQAGGSPRGRQFAAKSADSIIAVANGVEGMKAYRDDVRARAAAQGRNPDDIKVLFVIGPVLGETEEEARAKKQRMDSDPDAIMQSLAGLSSVTDIDFSQFDLDKPLPRLETNGERGSLDKFAQWGSNKTLRQLVMDNGGTSDSIELVGTPDQVAEQMGEANEAMGGGDGFLISAPYMRVSKQYITEICEGLIPALQRRGLTRTQYTTSHLRDTLREF